jgi:hypothetical protein
MLQPVPIDLTINMSIMTRFQQDYDQILTNFIPYFDPYIVISWRVPSYPDQEIRSQVIWSGNVATQYPFDINATQVARVVGETSFIFKGWLFKSAPAPEGRIFQINTDYSTLSELSTQYTEASLDSTTTERKTLNAVPSPKIVT